jgi:ribosomal protein L29
VKYTIQVGLVTECAHKDQKIEAREKGVEASNKSIEDLRSKLVTLEVDKKVSEFSLNFMDIRGKNEPDESIYMSCVELIAKVEKVKKNLYGAAHHDFDNVGSR